MSGIKQRSYQEACDDIYKDAILDLEILSDDMEDGDTKDGLKIAVDYLRDKRRELY